MRKTFWIIPAILLLSTLASARIVDRILAQVNNDIITLSDLNREMAQLRQDLASKYAGEQLKQAIQQAEKEVLEDLIRKKLLLQKATELGFGANIDLQVSAYIEGIRKENKIKDMQEFERALAQQGLTLVAFRQQIRESMITQGLVQEFVNSRITILTQEVEKYYKDHAAEFTIPEELTLSEIIIPVGDNPAEAEAKALEVRNRLVQGESFSTLASQYSSGPTASKGGGIGTYVTAKLNPEIAKAVASVKEGEVSTVLRSKEGNVIYRVDSRKVATVRPLEEVRDEIRNRLWRQKFNPELDRFVAQLKEDAYIQIFGETK